MENNEFENVVEKSELLTEAEEIKKDILILKREMDGFRIDPPHYLNHKKKELLSEMLKQLNDYYSFIEKLITNLKSENETV